MTREVLLNTLQHIDSIGYLTITGGEPSLAPEVIEDMLLQFLWKKIDVEFFYIVSNGMPHNKYQRFLEAVSRLYDWCDEKEACSLTISRDQFHPFDPYRHLSKFELRDEYGHHYGEFPPYFHPDARKKDIWRLLNEGRAKKLHQDTDLMEQQVPWGTRDDTTVLEPEVYVSSNGNVVSCCNMAFHRIDREAKGNVLITPLPQIIESYCKREEDAWQEEVAVA
jgi:hypothetical protein